MNKVSVLVCLGSLEAAGSCDRLWFTWVLAAVMVLEVASSRWLRIREKSWKDGGNRRRKAHCFFFFFNNVIEWSDSRGLCHAGWAWLPWEPLPAQHSLHSCHTQQVQLKAAKYHMVSMEHTGWVRGINNATLSFSTSRKWCWKQQVVRDASRWQKPAYGCKPEITFYQVYLFKWQKYQFKSMHEKK